MVNSRQLKVGYLKISAKWSVSRVAELSTIGTMCFCIAYLETFLGPTPGILKLRFQNSIKATSPKHFSSKMALWIDCAYMAVCKINKEIFGGCFKSRDVFEFGENPSKCPSHQHHNADVSRLAWHFLVITMATGAFHIGTEMLARAVWRSFFWRLLWQSMPPLHASMWRCKLNFAQLLPPRCNARACVVPRASARIFW